MKHQIISFLRAVFLFPFNILMGLASGAISAQGSKLSMGTGAGGAITITAISKAFRGEITGTHALSKGDRVTFAGIVGMTELNGVTATVVDVTGTTKFVIDVDTRAFTTWSSAGTATPATWTQIKGVKSFNPDGVSISKLVTTDLDSTAEESIPGLPSFGTLPFNINYVKADPGLVAARAAAVGGLVKSFKLELPNGVDTLTFDGYFTKFPTIPEGAVDGLALGNATIQITGAVTQA